MKNESVYDNVLSQAIAGKTVLECIIELTMYEQEKSNNSNIRTKKRLEQFIITTLSVALVIREIFVRAENELPFTEALPPFVELGKLFNIKPIADLENRFSVEDKPTAVNYYELLGVDQNDKTPAGKIAKKSSILHAELVKMITQYQSIPKLKERSKIVKTSKITPKKKMSSEVDADVIKSIKDRLRYFQKNLPKVSLQEINEVPASLLNDLENITNTNQTLALRFEEVARHIELVVPTLSVVDGDKIYNDFFKIRLDSGIPISDKVQKIIKLYGWV